MKDGVLMVRNLGELQHWLRQATPAVQWIQVEGLLDQPEAWADAARVRSDVALDVVMSDPLVEYPMLYHLVDVHNARGVRVTIPMRAGFLKALRLAAALHLPVRLLPGQPDGEELLELTEAVHFYLHDPMVDVPMEFFHSALGWSSGMLTTDLWSAVELDHVGRLEQDHAECVTCAWSGFCHGYFKLPDAGYSCAGIVKVLDQLGAAAREIAVEIGVPETQAEAATSVADL